MFQLVRVRLFLPRQLRQGVLLLLIIALNARAQLLSGDYQIPTEQSFDGRGFSYSLKHLESCDTHSTFAITFPSPITTAVASNNSVPGELYVPKGLPNTRQYPAAIVIHILHGNFELERAICQTLASKGITAMFFKLPYYGERGGQNGRREMTSDPQRFIDTLTQATADTRRSVDIISSLPFISPKKVGVTGGSLGAIMSASICGFEPRINRAFLILGGGNLRTIIMNAHETRHLKAFIDRLPEAEREAVFAKLLEIDPLAQGPALQRLSRQGKFKMICAAEDEVVFPDCSRELAAVAGCDITWLPGLGHYTVAAAMPQIMDELVRFFSADRPASWRSPAEITAQNNAMRLTGSFLQGALSLLNSSPMPGSMHRCQLDFSINLPTNTLKGSIDYCRGSGGRYRIAGTIPQLGLAQIGQGEYPWLAGANNSVFVGTIDAQAGRGCTQYITPRLMIQWQVGVGALAGAAMAPDLLKQFCTISNSSAPDGGASLIMSSTHDQVQAEVTLGFAPDETPREMLFNAMGYSGTITIKEWLINTPEQAEIFAPPASDNTTNVRQEDVLRMIAALMERLLEETE